MQLARPLDGIDNVLPNCAWSCSCVRRRDRARRGARPAGGRRVIAPLAEVAADRAAHRARPRTSRAGIQYHADDEVGQLATRFNAMIERLQHSREALDESVRAQRQFVADASHELRTPITSLRTNIEVLLGRRRADRRRSPRLLADVLEQSEELSTLIGDVIELARGDLPITSAEDVRLDRVVADCVTRARRDFPDVGSRARSSRWSSTGVPERLARAVNNLLDNAAHSFRGRRGRSRSWSTSEASSVRDHGTGIDPATFRTCSTGFYRGANSRHRQGSGLGLAIVRQVAVQHGGS